MLIDALLLAAGFGTRLRPLTHEIPKALLPLYGTPFLDLHIERLLGPAGSGDSGRELRADRIVINGHHLADTVRAHVARHPRADRLAFSFEPQILGTGGAIRRAAEWLRSDPFLVLNSDAFFPLPGRELPDYQRDRGFTATMVLAPSPIHPNVLVEQGRVTAILRERTERRGLTYTGCCLLSHAFLDLLPAEGVHDLRDAFDALIPPGRLGAWIMPDEPLLVDVGTPARYLAAHRVCTPATAARYGLLLPASGMTLAAGSGFIAYGATVGAGSVVQDSIVLGGARVAPGILVRGSILGPDVVVAEDVRDLLITTRGQTPVR